MNNQILCPHFDRCSGCVINTDVDQLPLYFSAREYFSSKGYDLPPLVVGPACGWRCRAKLAVRRNLASGATSIGLFRAGTHDVEAIPHCRVHHPNINRAVASIQRWIDHEGICAYDESTLEGELRYLLFAVERATQRIQLTVVVNGAWDSVKQRWTKLLTALWDAEPALWHSVWVNSNSSRGNVIASQEWNFVRGEQWLWDSIDRVDVAFHSSAFAQANLNLFERVVADLCEGIAPGASVTEYYAGVGVIGLNLAVRGCRVQLNERSPGAEECFVKSLERLPREVHQRVSFHTGSVDGHLALLEGVDIVIVDPPRKGLDASLLKSLLAYPEGLELRYLSCGWVAFQRDCDALLNAGWRLASARAYLLFPGTDQLEVLAVFK